MMQQITRLLPRARRPPLVCHLLALALAALLSGIAGALAQVSPSSAPPQAAASPQLTVYVSESCPHCAKAKAWLPQLQRQRPQLRLQVIAIDRDPDAQQELMALSRAAGVWPPGVPSFASRERLLVGFAGAERSGPQLLALVDGRPAGVLADGPRSGSPQTETGEPQTVGGLAGGLSVSRLGLPLFTLALGLLDGFNPCAMWVLLFLLSLLVHLRSRRRLALVAGTFVLVSGAVYYAFMAAWLNVFLAVGLATPIRIALALLALLIGGINLGESLRAEGDYTLAIPSAAKPGLYARMRAVMLSRSLGGALVGVTLLAVVVNLVELLCTAGLPALYTAVLSQQNLTPLQHHGYLGLYILGYIADDSLMVLAAVAALGSRRLGPRGGRWLKRLSGAVMLLLGLVLLLRPQWLR